MHLINYHISENYQRRGMRRLQLPITFLQVAMRMPELAEVRIQTLSIPAFNPHYMRLSLSCYRRPSFLIVQS